MDDRVDLLLVENLVDGRLIQQVGLIKGWTGAGDFFDAVEYLRLGVGKVVDDDNLLPCLNQLHNGVAADESGAAGDKNSHSIALLFGCFGLWVPNKFLCALSV